METQAHGWTQDEFCAIVIRQEIVYDNDQRPFSNQITQLTPRAEIT